MKPLLMLAILLSFVIFTHAQVTTNFKNTDVITERGKFNRTFRSKSPYVLAARNINALLQKEADENRKSAEVKPFRIAEPVNVDIDVTREASWTEDSQYAYGKFTLVATGALSVSFNFDQFELPKGTELYVYSERGEMITGPVTSEDNNPDRFWGSWVYKGGTFTVDFKTPLISKKSLKLHISNVAYGYKKIYDVKVGDFGASGACNNNVLCAIGNGWQNERHSVALILNGSGSAICSGALVNNTCSANLPYLLTANHCFDGDVANWRFTFKAWSPTCSTSQNANGLTFNGSTLRARHTTSDFCLVEMNNVPAPTSGITYAGWNRSSTPAANGTGIHHPSGDVMKISVANNALTRASAFGGTNNTWRANWSSGVTEGGSSGSPLFDQNHRIVGQLQGGPSGCGSPDLFDFYGSFDLSWNGGGTSTTRLSNWLDPLNTGATTTNTRIPPSVAVTANPVCSSTSFSVVNLPVGATVAWSSSNSVGLPINPSTGAANRANNYNGSATVTATITPPAGCSGTEITVTKTVWVGLPSTMPEFTTVTYDGALTPSVCEGLVQTFTTGQHQLKALTAGSSNYPQFTLYSSGFVTGGSSANDYNFNVKRDDIQFTIMYSITEGCATVTRCTYFSNNGVIISSVTYPNPANNEMTIQLGKPGEFKKVVVYNDKLETMLETVTDQTDLVIKTATFPEGSYIVKIGSDKKQTSHQIRIKH